MRTYFRELSFIATYPSIHNPNPNSGPPKHNIRYIPSSQYAIAMV